MTANKGTEGRTFRIGADRVLLVTLDRVAGLLTIETKTGGAVLDQEDDHPTAARDGA